MTGNDVNPEKDQNRVIDLFGTYRKYGYAMFPQQVAIYNNIASYMQNRTVLEAGCGIGLGTAVLERFSDYIVGTDKLKNNINFACCLYPWIEFKEWDINFPTQLKADVVVCIEAIEHVKNPQDAIKHLLDAAEEEVWLSTPNGTGKPRPPSNPYHVCEYTPEEVYQMIRNVTSGVTIRTHRWDSMYRVDDYCSSIDPLIYRIIKQ